MKENNHVIDIPQEYLLPLPFRVAGFTLILIGIGLFVLNSIGIPQHGFSGWIIGGLIFAVIGGLVATARYHLLIDPERREFTIYVWLFGVKQGKPESFGHVEMIYINRVIESTRMSSYTGHPSEMKEYLYKAFMKLDTGEKIHLDTDKNHDKLMERVKRYAERMKEIYTNKEVYPGN